MDLKIQSADTEAIRETLAVTSGQHHEISTRITAGTFETPYGELEFDKYFVTDRTAKKRHDFLVIRAAAPSPLEEAFSRLDRAASVGSFTVRKCSITIAAKMSDEPKGGAVAYSAELPITLADISNCEEVDVSESGDGFFWARISNRYLDVFIPNPKLEDHVPPYGVSLGVSSPGATNPHINSGTWQRADALLTPSHEALPGALGDMSLRSELVRLEPGLISS